MFSWAIEEFYYSAKRVSLQTAFDLMILERFMDENGVLREDSPTWWQFRHYFYKNGYHRQARKGIAREGLSDYQRNQRGLHGSEMEWRKRIGTYQMDATHADIYLVSRTDKSAVIGRPHIYMAVDTVTQLIAGIYVGFEDGEEAVNKFFAGQYDPVSAMRLRTRLHSVKSMESRLRQINGRAEGCRAKSSQIKAGNLPGNV